MKKNETLGFRMKQYEECFNVKMPRRFPMIVRLDGRAFHSWTRRVNCAKPFDEALMNLMAQTTKYLCENIGDCAFAYTQSDEISLLIRDDKSQFSTPWFDKRLQKVASLSASMATYFFNAENPYDRKLPAFFDSRAFILPQEEIRSYFIWRQNDASKNSLSMLAQSLYPHTELIGKKREELMDMCMSKGMNWNNLSIPKKRGYAVYRKPVVHNGKLGPVTRMKFFIDSQIPIFSSEDCTLFEEGK